MVAHLVSSWTWSDLFSIDFPKILGVKVPEDIDIIMDWSELFRLRKYQKVIINIAKMLDSESLQSAGEVFPSFKYFNGLYQTCSNLIAKHTNNNKQEKYQEWQELKRILCNIDNVSDLTRIHEILTFYESKGAKGTPYSTVCCHGKLVLVEFLKARLTNPNPKIGYVTLLHSITLYGQLDVLKLFKNDLNVRDDFGTTPLHIAVTYDYLQIASYIIERVEDKNPQDNAGQTPLHIAASRGCTTLVSYILDRISFKNPKDKYGNTPFLLAARKKHQRILAVFLEKVVISDTELRTASKYVNLSY